MIHPPGSISHEWGRRTDSLLRALLLYITFEPGKRFHRNRYFSVSDLSPLLPAFPAPRESTERSGDRSLRGRRPRRCAVQRPLIHPSAVQTSTLLVRPSLAHRRMWFRAVRSTEPEGGVALWIQLCRVRWDRGPASVPSGPLLSVFNIKIPVSTKRFYRLIFIRDRLFFTIEQKQFCIQSAMLIIYLTNEGACLTFKPV